MTSGEKLLNDFKKLPLKLQEIALKEIEKIYLERKSIIGG